MGVYKDRITIYEVAKAAGVSLATVSRVINNQSNVTEATKKRVEDTIKRLGYQPNALAQGLATNRTTNIGIVVPDVNYVHISNLLSGLIDIGKIYGYQTTLFVTKHSHQDAQEVISKLVTSHVDGAVVFDDELNQESINKLLEYKIPLVLIGNDYNIDSDKVCQIILNYSDELKKVIAKQLEKNQEKPIFVHSNNGKILQIIENNVLEGVDESKYTTMMVSDSYHETYSLFVDHFKKNKKGYFICPRKSFVVVLGKTQVTTYNAVHVLTNTKQKVVLTLDSVVYVA